MTDLSFFSSAGDPSVDELVLTRVEGRETISALYEYTLELTSELDEGLSIESIEAWLNEPCRFTFGDATVSGIIDELTLLPSDTASPLCYRARLVPQAWIATQTVQSRIFMDKTVVQIIESVLTEHAVTFSTSALAATYPAREYTVQYAESDFAFVSRLMEHYGLFYFFTQGTDAETMVIADANSACAPHDVFPTLSFNPGEEGLDGWISSMGRTHRPKTAALTLRDYNWRVPYLDSAGHMTERQLQLKADAPVDESTGRGSHFLYGDHFTDQAEGNLLAQVRAEAQMVGRVTHRAHVRAPGLAPGHRVLTLNMPVSDLEQEYLVVSVRTVVAPGGGVSDAFLQEMEAIPFTVAFRPDRVTARPSISGYMHAVVDGEVHGTAAPIDVQGRYKVIMPYDRAAKSGGAASRWIRMSQASAGSDYGMHLPLHIGTEIVVAHLDGNPDRPVILGSVPNVDTQSPVVEANATMSRIRTRANILFELEDDA